MMKPQYTVYNDSEIAVGLFAKDQDADDRHLLHLGMRWLNPPSAVGKNGEELESTNIMGGETDWFLLPHSFGISVGKKLVEQKAADCGLAEYFDEAGLKRMVVWLLELEEISGAMEY
jgi:hypothetical protein